MIVRISLFMKGSRIRLLFAKKNNWRGSPSQAPRQLARYRGFTLEIENREEKTTHRLSRSRGKSNLLLGYGPAVRRALVLRPPQLVDCGADPLGNPFPHSASPAVGERTHFATRHQTV